ncbi:Protein arginine n-methyltransferase [Musa troglodytarum]|uniref:Protein arginine n-methyltransferase n=2 Tax=Musa troglodytarum TaxID=320322 RepID=A0A9E7HPQ8_9LILI|nr:Protein arginine n-methyltransferase [Musa troglodytarum]
MMLGNGYASSPASRRRRGRPRGGGGSGYGFWQPQSLHHHQQQEISPVVPPCTEFDMAYFRAYSHIGVHEEMLKDRVRTETYRAAIMRYQHLISDKVVLDVGCGTGILAIFCAFAGARRVYAVDASEIAVQASEVVKENNLSDKVTVLLGRVEDVSIDEKVDVIVSEWMGYILLYELYMAPVTHADRYRESIDFWRDVYGINMSAMLPLAKQCAFEEPCIETISGENVLTWPILVKEVDCYTVTIQELESVTAKFSFSSMLRAPLHGFAFWFDVVFNGPANYSSNHHLQPPLGSLVDQQSHGSSQSKKRIKSDEGIVLSTAPEDAPTHWQQTLLYLYDPIELQQDQKIEGSVTLSQSKENARFLNIHLEYSSGGRSFVKESVMR